MRSAGTTPSSTPSPGRGTGGPSTREGEVVTGTAVETEDREGGEEGPHTTGMNCRNEPILV